MWKVGVGRDRTLAHRRGGGKRGVGRRGARERQLAPVILC